MRHYSELKGAALGFLFFLWSLWFFSFSGRVIFSPLLPLIEDEFVISHARASSIFMWQSMGYATGLILSGFYAGRFGFKKSILVSFAALACMCFCVPFVKLFSIFYILLFFNGFSTGVYLPSIMPLIREHFAETHWGKAISIYDSAASVSIFSVPFIVLFLLKYFHWRGIFDLLGIALIIVAVLFALKGEELKISEPHTMVFGDLITRKSLWILVTAMAFITGANMGVYLILPLYLTKELSMNISHANTLLGISRLGGVGVAILCGFLVNRFDLKKLMFTLMIISGILTVLLGISPKPSMGVLLFFQSIFATGLMPISFVCTTRLFNRQTISMAVAFITLSSSLFGSGLMPYLLGLSGDLLSFRFGITILGVMLTAVSFIMLSLKELGRAD
ncbi:MAG TPA: MFS transporter [Syntrophorhabdaceae bacterium]|nr:MFS transporter [Syntrophorhabdaceae bacterium]